MQFLDRENSRWEQAEQQQMRARQREEASAQNHRLGLKRTANSNG